MQIHEIPLDQIRPAPWNSPSRLDPAKVQGLADSIQREGQKSAALIRPVEAEAPVKYELVFGHRRYAAKQLLAVKDVTQATIRAEIQEMEAEQAMIVSGIENLQRENFSDIEEAEFFQTCGEKYEELAAAILSEKLSVSPRYIRKRIEILKLPEVALELWRSETWHVGHMEQLLRLGGNEAVAEFFEALAESRNEPEELAVWELKEAIDSLAVPLHSGNFDKTDCKACRKNTDCQQLLFGGESEKGKCLDQGCFRQKQQAWLDLNWSTCKENKFGTQAAIIGDYHSKTTGEFSDYSFGLKPGEKCKSCPHFTTILALMGRDNSFRAYRDMACLGEAACFAAVQRSGKQKQGGNGNGKGAERDPDAPRVAWHGEHFRQQFYQQEIPELMAGLTKDDPRHLQLTLATVLYSARTLHEWFWQELGQVVPEKPEWQTFTLPFHQLLGLVQTLEAHQVKALLAEALVKIALRTDRGYEISFVDADRQALAKFLDVDFSRYQVTEEYLQKKTKAELVRFIVHDSELMEEDDFRKAMKQRGFATAEMLAQAKKGVLVGLILQSGVDLHGRLPKEIANLPELGGAEDR